MQRFECFSKYLDEQFLKLLLLVTAICLSQARLKMIDYARENSYPTPFANTSLLPILVLSLASQKNSPTRLQTPSSISSEYDYIVVGAGSAGSTVAARLSEASCVNVLLLEAGKPPPIISDLPAIARNLWFTDLDWQFKTTPQAHTGRLLKNRQVIWPSGKALGGSSVINAVLDVRGNKKNYNDWAKQGAKGWRYKDVLPYFKKMEDNKNFHNKYHGVGGPITVEKPNYNSEIKGPIYQAARNMGYEEVDINGKKQTGFADFQATVRKQQRCSTAKGYLVPAENRTNLHILPNAFVKKIIIKDRTADGVEFEVNGTTYIVKARKEVIMSAGTTNTAQLLMLSGIGPKKELRKFKIPVIADLPVGENMQDHCSAIIGFELNSSLTRKIPLNTSVDNYVSFRKGKLASAEFISAVAFLNGHAVRPPVDDPNFELYFFETSTEDPKNNFGLTDAAFNKVYAPYNNSTLYSCFSQILQPKSRGHVRLQSADPRTPPLINPNYFANPKDLEDIVEGMKVCYRIGTSEAMKKLGSKPFKTLYPGCEKFRASEDEYFRCQAQSVVVTMSHQVGTAKMGNARDPSTVVDPQLRVKGINNLRVVDASVMPIIPSGNTNVPTIMVAEKASDIIKQSIKCCRKGGK